MSAAAQGLRAPDPEDFAFDLPESAIAQQPPAARDGGRLLLLDRSTGARAHHQVRGLPELLDPGDLIVVNTTRVLPARLRGHKQSGGAVEALLLGPAEADAPGARRLRALLKCSGRLRPGLALCFARGNAEIAAAVDTIGERGECVLAFAAGADPYSLGEAPLPPYIRRGSDAEPTTEASQRALDDERYQTVFASEEGAVAAPTAGLHLSVPLLGALAERGVERAEVVLHVGLGTFKPLSEEQLRSGKLHRERFRLPAQTVDAIHATRERGGRVVAIGTTTTRVLESCVDAEGQLRPGEGETELFLKPGDRFRAVDALLTNFHLPRSSLLMLVAAFAGRQAVLDAYAEAVERGYRFYSYGDAMLIR